MVVISVQNLSVHSPVHESSPESRVQSPACEVTHIIIQLHHAHCTNLQFGQLDKSRAGIMIDESAKSYQA